MNARLRVLIADDERPARSFLAALLRSFDDVLVSKGYLSKEQLAVRRRAPRREKKKQLRLGDSLDLVKCGLLTFKQLNECHREARSQSVGWRPTAPEPP